jgi:hypothetical protein
MIPATVITEESPCMGGRHESCPVFQDAARPPRQPPPPTLEAAKPQEPAEADEPAKPCIWLREQIVSYRLCTRNYECDTCEFAQMLHDLNRRYVEPPNFAETLEELRRKPAKLRICKYVVLGKMALEPCHKDYHCWDCPTYLAMREKIVASQDVADF